MGRTSILERLKIADGKHLTVSEHSVDIDHPLHWHSFFEIEIILSGQGRYIINDIVYDIEECNVFLLTSTDFHYLEVETPIRLLNLSFDEEMIGEKELGHLLFSNTQKAYAFEKEALNRLIEATKLLAHECAIDGDSQKSLLSYILKCICRENELMSVSRAELKHYSGIKKAIVYMEMHFREQIYLADIAREAGYHPAYFSELFKKVTGETYIDALTRLRIGYARTLLANGFSVSDACFSSGFGSLSNFLTVFKKNCSIPPSAYRTKFLNQR